MTCKKVAIEVVVATLLVFSAGVAHADVFKFRGGVIGGVAGGNGAEDADFFKIAGGGAVGVEVGVQILFIGVIADYRYFFGGDSPAHLLSANLGGEWAINITKRLSIPFRVLAGLLAGKLTDSAYSNINDIGFGARAGVGIDYRFAGPLAIGIIPQLGYHAMLTGGGVGAKVSHGWDLQALAHLRLTFGL